MNRIHALITMLFGFGFGAAAMMIAGHSIESKPFDITEAKSVLAKLYSVSRGSSRTDASLFMWADGAVNLSIEIDVGSKLTGRGVNLPAAVADLKAHSEVVGTALK